MVERIRTTIEQAIRFITRDIWRTGGHKVFKSFILAARNILEERLNARASALTYSTLLALVPLLAVLFGIARGFRFQEVIQGEVSATFGGRTQAFNRLFELVDRSLDYAQGNWLLGIGMALLLYTVVSLLAKVEQNFNHIWQVKTSRNFRRMVADYLALIIIAPIFLVVSAGLSLYLNAAAGDGVVVSSLIKLSPFLITIFLFTVLFLYIPNTRVKFGSAFFAGVFTGICFQLFQMLYIGGQIWLTQYNAIYGSFAALPLLLLWMQLTWFIILFGVELSYAFQNAHTFNFEHETTHISSRYRDFVYLLITALIVRRFEKGEKPYTAAELSEKHRIPTRLTADVLFRLGEVGVLVETPVESTSSFSAGTPEVAYLPAMDIQKMSVAWLFERLDRHGSEEFEIDTDVEFRPEWEAILTLRTLVRENYPRLIKEL